MKSSKELLEEIINKKEHISQAIALAYADGNEEKKDKYLKVIGPRIDGAKTFVFDKPVLSVYNQSIDKIYEEINKKLGYNFREKVSLGPYKYDNDPYVADFEGIDQKTQDILKESYRAISKYLLKGNITCQDYVNMYKEHGKQYIKDIYKLVFELQEKRKNRFLKEFISDQAYLIDVKKITNKTSSLMRYFDIKSSDDFMNLYTEIASLDLDPKKLSEEEYKLYINNIKKFEKRKNARDIIESKAKRKKILNQLEEIYSNEFMKKCLESHSVQEYLKMYSFEYNSKNFKKIVNDYLYTRKCHGYVGDDILDNKKFSKVMFRNDSLTESKKQEVNALILHEFIHVSERPTYGLDKLRSFSYVYTNLNEGITEYLAYEGLKYLDVNLVDIEDVRERRSLYENLVPMVEMLKNSCVWDALIKSKINNDISFITKKIGIEAIELNRLFGVVCDKTRNHQEDYIYEYEDLEKLIKQFEKEEQKRINKIAKNKA